jgi:GNAT superfamily N-acetyltransferase
VIPLEIRPARPDDRDAVMRISATVWEGADYLPSVWDGWIDEPAESGFLLAGDVDGSLVAIQHVSIQPCGVAWIEGIRVDPGYRNQGIGGRMLERALEMARERGCTRARLSTATVNRSSTRIAQSHGFEQIGGFRIYSASPDSNPRDEVRGVTRAKVSPADIEDLRQRIGEPESLIVRQWTAYDLPDQLSSDAFPHSLVCAPDSETEGIALASDSRDETEISVAFLAGSHRAVASLGRELRRAAHVADKEGVSGTLRHSVDRDAGLVEAGYERNEHLVVAIFERDL